MLQLKIRKVKKHLSENLFKGPITPLQAFYFSPLLFALKANNLRSYVDYQKLISITEWNIYLLLLIDEVIGKIIGCKQFTRLDMILTFNKPRMHSESNDYTKFTIVLGFYKYLLLLFSLTNSPSLFQQYINILLFEHLNEFCPTCQDHVFIYSKT